MRMPSWMYSCRDFNADASDYLDQDLPFWRSLNLRMHGVICVHCRRYLSQLRMVSKAYRLLDHHDSDLSPEQTDMLINSVLEKSKDRGS